MAMALLRASKILKETDPELSLLCFYHATELYYHIEMAWDETCCGLEPGMKAFRELKLVSFVDFFSEYFLFSHQYLMMLYETDYTRWNLVGYKTYTESDGFQCWTRYFGEQTLPGDWQ